MSLLIQKGFLKHLNVKTMEDLSTEELGVRINSENIAKLEQKFQKQSILTLVMGAAITALVFNSLK